MVTTRSADKQTRVKDFAQKKSATRPADTPVESARQPSYHGSLLSPPPSPTRKRKSQSSDLKEEQSKRSKTDGSDTVSKEDSDNVIIINRAPVLHLWGASVTHFLYPDLEWSTCLSAGNAISTICAIAKGRSVGTIDKPQDAEKSKAKKKEQEKREGDYGVLEVMQFKLNLKEGTVYVSGKPQSSNEETLERKYGERYEDVKTVFDEGLQAWKGKEMQLSKAAFGMYEDFRPNIAKGQKGWGRKGALNLKAVGNILEK